MPRTTSEKIEDAFRRMTPIDDAVREAAREAVLRHKKLGNSVATLRDGKVIVIPAAEIEVPDSPRAPADKSHAA